MELPIRGRAGFSDQPQEAPTNDFQSPTFAFSAEERRSVPVGVFVALLAIIAAALLLTYSSQGHALLRQGMSRLNDVRVHFGGRPAAPTANLPATEAPPPEPVAAAPALASPSDSTTPTQSVTETKPANSVVSDSDSGNVGPSSDTPPVPVRPKIRYVPPNVMVGYLLSAPRPQYPDEARADHIQGRVALQATISKTGTIETVHVINGPQPLLGAAIDGVRDWKYKPYYVDGRPVEVTTIVYVDFALRRPPAKAYEGFNALR